jgi:hypothetical protein
MPVLLRAARNRRILSMERSEGVGSRGALPGRPLPPCLPLPPWFVGAITGMRVGASERRRKARGVQTCSPAGVSAPPIPPLEDQETMCGWRTTRAGPTPFLQLWRERH